LVIDAARRRIESDGAVSLKISDIVRETKIADVIIYRHFGDRRGVIVEALAETWIEFTQASLVEARAIIESAPDRGITASMLAALMVPPENAMFRRRRWLRIQTLSAAQEFPELRERIAAEQVGVGRELDDLLEIIRRKNGLEPPPVTMATIRANLLGASIGLVLDDVAGGLLSDAEQFAFWKHFFVCFGLAAPE
jgi:AcrR family transcriptional regulator